MAHVMRMGNVAILGLALALGACSSDNAGVETDTSVQLDGLSDVGDVVFRPPDGDIEVVDQIQQWDIQNRPPLVDPIPGVTVKMGESVEVDLAPYFADPEQADDQLELSWSAKHVALELVGVGKVRVIGPVDWSGVDPVKVTVTDGGGLSNTEQMAVTVEFVDAVEPSDVVDQDTALPDVVEDNKPDPEDGVEDVAKPCGWVEFSYQDSQAALVELAGSFNNWGNPNKWKMTAAGGGLWTYGVQLQPGEVQYKFVVDGEWKLDPANPNQVDDGYGGKNSVLTVGPCG